MADVVTNVGATIITARMIEPPAGSMPEPKFVAWGTGAGTAAVADTTLFTESTEARTSGTSTVQTTTTSEDTYRVVGTITADGTKAITNAGLFTAASGPSLLCKSDFATINLLINDSITFTFNVQFNQ